MRQVRAEGKHGGIKQKKSWKKENGPDEREEEEEEDRGGRDTCGCVDEEEKEEKQEEEEEGLFTLRLCADLAYTHIHAQCRQQILITPY